MTRGKKHGKSEVAKIATKQSRCCWLLNEVQGVLGNVQMDFYRESSARLRLPLRLIGAPYAFRKGTYQKQASTLEAYPCHT